MKLGNGLEIERKFLIELPTQEFLSSLHHIEIVQTYLTPMNKFERRVRQCKENNKTTYVYTTKQKLTEMIRYEVEKQISSTEYRHLLTETKKGTHSINKVRYLYPFENHTFEIDIYPFFASQAIMEVELANEDEKFTLPPDIKVIKEVTGEDYYKNTYFAMDIFLDTL